MSTKTRLVANIGAMTIAALFLVCCSPVDSTRDEQTGSGSSQEGVSFTEGFHKEELAGGEKLRWSQQRGTFTIQAPSAGRYRLTFRPVTVFSSAQNTIEVSVNGQPVGTISTSTSDFPNAPTTAVQAPLQAGANTVALASNQPEARLGPNDPRRAAFALVGRIGLEPVP